LERILQAKAVGAFAVHLAGYVRRVCAGETVHSVRKWLSVFAIEHFPVAVSR
jgi:hypothetical protein